MPRRHSPPDPLASRAEENVLPELFAFRHRRPQSRRASLGSLLVRQAQPERCSIARPALYADRASMLFQNLVANCQTKPTTSRPSTESRLKNAWQIAFRDARSGIPYRDLNPVRAQVGAAKT